jgi:alkylation response protein AidB-like acyl-CoA dehydrogenase
MSLVYTDDERMLQDAAREFLAAESPVAALRALRDNRDETGFSRELWAKFAGMGWAGVLVPEAHGGLGFSHAGAGILCEQMGRTLCASPFFASAVLGASLLRLAGSEGQQASLLPRVARGECLLALALDETARHDPLAVATRAVAEGDGYVLHGDKRLVIDGHVADTLIVVARTAGNPGDAHGISLFLVDPREQGLTIERTVTVDSRNAARLRLDGVRVGARALLGAPDAGHAALERTLDIARACLAAELLGVASEAFARTVEYLKQRKQFGRIIGEYQGLQHRAAVLFCELENTRSAVLAALRAADDPEVALAPHASLAKAKATATATLAVNEAVQMHGGIGMTDELEIGFFMKRAAALRTLFGDVYYHADRYALANGF